MVTRLNMSLSLAVAGSIALLSVSAEALAAERPNIVLIISDDQAWTDYGFMGHKTIRTPNLDRFASESLVFRRGYVPTALCRPSLMTLATGLYAHQHRTTGNDPAETPENERHVQETGEPARALLISHIDELVTLPEALGELGYLSHQSGKWWEGSYQRGGFTDGMTRGYPEEGGRHGDDGLEIGRTTMEPVFGFIDMAVERGQPFFIWFAPFLPHTPHNAPERILNRYLEAGLPEPVARYYANCEWFDESVGRLLGRLEEKGLNDNTLVIYLTDNGWIQLPDANGYAPRSKRSPYEGGTRTPIMFRWPEVFQPGEWEDLVTSIDIVPTILGAAGAEVPVNLPGLNLLPALRDGSSIPRDAIFGEAFAHDIADIENPQASLLYRWVIEGYWKLLLTYDGRPGRMTYPPTSAEPQLYDLRSDPREEKNLAAEMPELVERLSQRIADWWPVTERRQAVAR